MLGHGGRLYAVHERGQERLKVLASDALAMAGIPCSASQASKLVPTVL